MDPQGKGGKHSIFHTKCYHFYFNWRWSQYPFTFNSANNTTQPFSCFCVHERKTWIVCKLRGWPSLRSSKFTGKQPEKGLGTDVVLHRRSIKRTGWHSVTQCLMHTISLKWTWSGWNRTEFSPYGMVFEILQQTAVVLQRMEGSLY